MSRRLRLHPGAQRELAEAAAYYEAESSGLGDAFLAEVVRTFDRILVFPEACPVSRGGIRIKVLDAFPYSLYYAIIADDDVLVVSIAHHKRRPFYWDDRV
jgi:plasmid stabilization system protein ParE